MKKVPTIFKRDPANPKRVTQEINPCAQWVFDGEGIATRKYDGTAALYRNGQWFKRYDCKQGRTPPEGFQPADDPDPTTGHWPGWLAVSDSPADQWLREAIQSGKDSFGIEFTDGTYELCGPKVQGNPEHFERHVLVRHGSVQWPEFGKLINEYSLRVFFSAIDVEGIVWHHPDGRMAKIKARDFGISR